MRYRLKKGKSPFSEMDGPHAGMKYRIGETYSAEEIPDGKMSRFDPVGEPVSKPALKDIRKKEPAEPDSMKDKEA